MKKYIFILIIAMFSCQLPDNEVSYTEGLVVFGRIELFEFMNETIGTIDTLRVSLSSDINSNIDNANQLYIDDAQVTISGPFGDTDEITEIQLMSYGSLGKYFIPDSINYSIQENKNYILNVSYNNYNVSAKTTTHDYLNI